MIVKINDKEITLRKTFRSLIMYEKATGASFAMSTVTDMIMYFYCVVATSMKDGDEITFDDFVDWLDEDNVKLLEFTKWIAEQNKIEELTQSKKKVTRKKQEK